ncbi:hypothetical protein C2S53_010622, partial [Perilla frutescens var. hirtella]
MDSFTKVFFAEAASS